MFSAEDKESNSDVEEIDNNDYSPQRDSSEQEDELHRRCEINGLLLSQTQLDRPQGLRSNEQDATFTNREEESGIGADDGECFELLENLKKTLDEGSIGFGCGSEPDENLYGVSTKWIHHAYETFKMNKRIKVPIDNSDLVNSEDECLQAGVKPRRDFVFITRSDWNRLLNGFPPSKKVKTLVLPNGRIANTYIEDSLKIYDSPLDCKQPSGELERRLENNTSGAEASYAHSLAQEDAYNQPPAHDRVESSDNSEAEMSSSVSDGVPDLNLCQFRNEEEGEMGYIFNYRSNPKTSDLLRDLVSIGSNELDSQLKIPSTPPKSKELALPPGTVGIHNMGNTCFMNSALQCMSSTMPLTLYFLDKRWLNDLNSNNPAGSGGAVAKAYAGLICQLWGVYQDLPRSIIPRDFRIAFGKVGGAFMDYYQHDGQEFLGFLLDVLHEDLNRVTRGIHMEIPDTKNLPESVAAKLHWDAHKTNNNSIISDLFQGQYKSTLECLKCGERSATFDMYMFLSLPIVEHFTFPVTAYFLSFANPSTYPSAIKLEFNMAPTPTARDLKCEVAKRIGVDLVNDLIDKYTVLLYSSSTISSILKDNDQLPAMCSYKKIFVLETNSTQFGHNDGKSVPSDSSYVTIPAHFVNSQGRKTSQFAWKSVSLGFPLIFSLPSVIRVPIPAKKAAQLKKQRLTFRDVQNDPLLCVDVYQEYMDIIGLHLLSVIVSSLRGFMNQEYVEALLNDEEDSGNPNSNPSDDVSSLNSSTCPTPGELAGTRSKDALLCFSEYTYEDRSQSGAPENKTKTTDSLKKQKLHTDADQDCSIDNFIHMKSSKHYVDDDIHPVYMKQRAGIRDPLANKLYKMVKIYISTPRDSCSYWPSYDLSSSFSHFYSRKWATPSLCNITCLSANEDGSFASQYRDGFYIETDTSDGFEYQSKKSPTAPKNGIQSFKSFINSSMNMGSELTAFPHSSSPKSLRAGPYSDQRSRTDPSPDYSYGHLSQGKEEDPNQNSESLYKTPSSSTKGSNEGSVFSCNGPMFNDGCADKGGHLHEDISFDTSYKIDGYTEDRSPDSACVFAYRVPRNGVIVVEWAASLLENLFHRSATPKDSLLGQWNFVEDSKNREILLERESQINKKKCLDLLDCVRAFCDEEVLSENDSWLCPSCKIHQPAKKKLDIWSVPEVLIFHLKRFSSSFCGVKSSSSSKIDAYVDAKLEGLELSEVIIGNTNNSDGTSSPEENIYDLFAVSNHYGALLGGHYVAYTMNPLDNNWYCFDDSKVYPISPKDVITPAAYFLLYQRRENSPKNEFKKVFKDCKPTISPVDPSMEHAYL